jgi:hypothetical protein
MTYENCKKYMEESTNEKVKEFWANRIKRKYPNTIIKKEEIVEEKPSKAKKKVNKE